MGHRKRDCPQAVPCFFTRKSDMNFHDLIACRADAEHGDRALDDALELLDICLNGRGQLVEGAAVRDVLGKAVEFLIDRLAVNEIHEVRRELGNGLAVLQLVGYADLELRQAATINTAKQLADSGFDVVFLAPDATGHITPEVLSEALTEDTVLLSCQLVNNEIGTVQPVEQLGKLLKAKAPKALFHIDAVQGLCRVRLTPKKWNCDLMSVSGHKIGAPKGIGALYVKKGLRLPPLTFGGGQEKGMRPGTEAVPNIAAFAKACEIRMAHFDEDYAHVQELADYLRQQVEAELPTAVINGEGDIPHVVNLSMPGCKSEVMLHVLEGDEVYISSGSACSKGKQSGVLKALGLPKTRTDSALRVSFAPFNTREDVDAFIAAVKKGAKMFRR